MTEFRLSSIRTIALLGAGMVAAVAVVMLILHLMEGRKVVTFRAFVDGVDVVKLSGKNLWIEHQEHQLPNKMFIDGKTWNPVWNKNTSATGELKPPFNPRKPESVKLIRPLGRGTISIVEMPTPANGIRSFCKV